MARRKPFDPYAVGYFAEVRHISNRTGYEWMVVQDEYNTFNVESIPLVAIAKGTAWNHRSAYEIAFRVLDVFVAIDKNLLHTVKDDDVDLVCSLMCPKAQEYIHACWLEKHKRQQSHHESAEIRSYEW